MKKLSPLCHDNQVPEQDPLKEGKVDAGSRISHFADRSGDGGVLESCDGSRTSSENSRAVLATALHRFNFQTIDLKNTSLNQDMRYGREWKKSRFAF